MTSNEYRAGMIKEFNLEQSDLIINMTYAKYDKNKDSLLSREELDASFGN